MKYAFFVLITITSISFMKSVIHLVFSNSTVCNCRFSDTYYNKMQAIDFRRERKDSSVFITVAHVCVELNLFSGGFISLKHP